MAKHLDVETDDTFQKLDWRAERIFWVILLIFVLAGLAGFFGRGGVSQSKAGSAAEKIEVKYERFLRYHTNDRLDISLYGIPQSQQTFSLEIDKAYINKIQIEDIYPQPQKTVVTPSGISFIFETAKASQTNIIFYLKPDKIGSVKTRLLFNHDHAVNISQFIYP